MSDVPKDLVDRSLESEHGLEKITEDHERDDLRYIIDGTESSPSRNMLVKEHGNDKSDEYLKRYGNKEHEVIPEQVPEHAGTEQLLIVFKAYEIIFIKTVPVGKALSDHGYDRPGSYNQKNEKSGKDTQIGDLRFLNF